MDGFVGIFGSPSRTVRCASAIADSIAPLGISLGSGIHAGEVHLTGRQSSGIAVHIAAGSQQQRIWGSVRSENDSWLGNWIGTRFRDRGTHQLRGLLEEIHLYAILQLGHQSQTCHPYEKRRVYEQPREAYVTDPNIPEQMRTARCHQSQRLLRSMIEPFSRRSLNGRFIGHESGRQASMNSPAQIRAGVQRKTLVEKSGVSGLR